MEVETGEIKAITNMGRIREGVYGETKNHAVADEIEQKFPKLNGKVEIYSVGTTIGSHTGPGTVALFFWGDERKD
mgnify:CR=1 FL=1